MISVKFQALVLKTGDRYCRIPVDITFTYDGESDPFAIQMIASERGQEEVVWYFSRELLLLAVHTYDQVGTGDVKFRLEEPRNGGGINSLLMCLNNGNGHVDVRLPQSAVVAFLNDTTNEALQAIGSLDALIDEELEDMLDG